MPITHIHSSDGSLIPYDETKVAHTILQATAAAGDPDQELANHMAEVVTFFLEKQFGDREQPPNTEEVADMIETVLLETAPPAVAKSHIIRRQRQRELEATVKVHRPGYAQKRLFPEDTLTVELEGSGEATHWERALIVRDLLDECDLAPRVAEMVAERVEQRVFDSGLETVTTGLIRELIDVELFELGLLEQRDRRALVGLPVSTLEETLLRGRPPGVDTVFSSPADVDRYITGSVFQRYALQEIHSPEVARAHIAARLNVHDLGSPMRLHSLRTSIEGLKYGWPAPGKAAPYPPTSLDEYLALVHRYAAECLALTNGEVVLAEVALSLAPLVQDLSEPARRQVLQRFVAGLPATSRLVLELPLVVPFEFRHAAVKRLANQMDTQGSALQAPALTVVRDLLSLIEEGLLGRGEATPKARLVLAPPALGNPETLSVLEVAARCTATTGQPGYLIAREESGGFGASIATSLRDRLRPDGLARYREPCIAATSLNLPQAVFESRGVEITDNDGFAGVCERLLTLARLTFSERFQFLLTALTRLTHPLLAIGESSDRDVHPAQITLGGYGRVNLVGLDEALRLIVGSTGALGQDNPEDMVRAGVRSLSFLAYALKEDEHTGRTPLPMVLGSGQDPDVAARFARIDSRMRPPLTEALRRLGAAAPERAYQPGTHLHVRFSPVEQVTREARFHTMLAEGNAITIPAGETPHSPSAILDVLKVAAHRTTARGLTFPLAQA